MTPAVCVTLSLLVIITGGLFFHHHGMRAELVMLGAILLFLTIAPAIPERTTP